jgi:sugar O-acyltransferase (sialic acid O-acetyltransferase NeuD family)
MTGGGAEDLIIIGAGGFSRDIAWAVEECNQTKPRWNLLGFLDDDPAKAGTIVSGYPVLGGIANSASYPDARLVLGVASYKNRGARRSIVEHMKWSPGRFATIVSPYAHVSHLTSIGHGCVILRLAVVSMDVVIGNHVLISSSCVIGHDAELSGYVTLAAGVRISGSVRVGEDVYAGSGSVIRDGLKIGAGALIGMGAAVFHDVREGQTVVGNPAKPLRKTRLAG